MLRSSAPQRTAQSRAAHPNPPFALKPNPHAPRDRESATSPQPPEQLPCWASSSRLMASAPHPASSSPPCPVSERKPCCSALIDKGDRFRAPAPDGYSYHFASCPCLEWDRSAPVAPVW